jgi:hypothetical protein
MKKIIYAITLFLCCFFPVAAEEMHLLLIGDTSSAIGKWISPDLERMKQQMAEVAGLLQCPLHVVELSDEAATIDHVFAAMDQIHVAPDDIFIFYFSGHGYRTRAKDATINPWPNLLFSVQREGVDFLDVVDAIREKSPRLLLAIADSCNSLLPDWLFPVRHAKSRRSLSMEEIKQYNANVLFRNLRGEILIAAASPEEQAWCTAQGALFTMAYSNALTRAIEGSIASDWSEILANASAAVQEKQTPYYLLHLE